MEDGCCEDCASFDGGQCPIYDAASELGEKVELFCCTRFVEDT